MCLRDGSETGPDYIGVSMGLAQGRMRKCTEHTSGPAVHLHLDLTTNDGLQVDMQE
jgi:hypothetical protein